MKRPDLSDTTVRRCGLAAVVLGVASIPLAPLNSLARMQIPDGRSDLDNPMASWWAEPAMRALRPRLLDFGDAQTVYLTYGKFYLLAVLAVLACAVATFSRRPDRLGWVERWGWRLTFTGLVLMCVGQVVAYWLAFVDEGYLVVLLAMLVGVFGNVLLGLGLIRSHFRPRLSAWLILLDLPLSIGLVSIATQATGMWPMMLAWGLIGWSLQRDAVTAGATPVEARSARRTSMAPQRR